MGSLLRTLREGEYPACIRDIMASFTSLTALAKEQINNNNNNNTTNHGYAIPGTGGLLETFSSDHFDIENTASIDNNWMEVEMDLTNESTMSLFQELEEVEEVKEE